MKPPEKPDSMTNTNTVTRIEMVGVYPEPKPKWGMIAPKNRKPSRKGKRK